MPSSIIEISYPTWPVDLTTAKNYLKIPLSVTGDDSLIQNIIIPGATRQLETALGVCLSARRFKQMQDGFPFFPYFQSPYAPLFGAAFPFYFGYGPIASYPYPAIGGLQNQMISPFVITLLRSPLISFSHISYVGTDGKNHGLLPGKDFVVDATSRPARISPVPGQRWPVGILGMNTVALFYSAGYGSLGTSTNNFLDGAIWQPLVSVQQNSYILDPNGFVWVQIAANAITGETEPAWTNVINATISDGIYNQIPGGGGNVPAVWKNNGKIVGPYQPNTVYNQPTIVQDPNGYLQMLIIPTLTSQASGMTFNQAFGAVSTDNGQAAWMNIGLDYSAGSIDPPDQTTEYLSEAISIPENLYNGILFLISHWYRNRDAVVGGQAVPTPWQLQEIIASERDWDFGPFGQP